MDDEKWQSNRGTGGHSGGAAFGNAGGGFYLIHVKGLLLTNQQSTAMGLGLLLTLGFYGYMVQAVGSAKRRSCAVVICALAMVIWLALLWQWRAFW